MQVKDLIRMLGRLLFVVSLVAALFFFQQTAQTRNELATMTLQKAEDDSMHDIALSRCSGETEAALRDLNDLQENFDDLKSKCKKQERDADEQAKKLKASHSSELEAAREKTSSCKRQLDELQGEQRADLHECVTKLNQCNQLNEDQKNENEDQKKEIDRLTARAKSAQESEQQAISSQSNLEARLASLGSEMASLEKSRRQLQVQVEELHQQIRSQQQQQQQQNTNNVNNPRDVIKQPVGDKTSGFSVDLKPSAAGDKNPVIVIRDPIKIDDGAEPVWMDRPKVLTDAGEAVDSAAAAPVIAESAAEPGLEQEEYENSEEKSLELNEQQRQQQKPLDSDLFERPPRSRSRRRVGLRDVEPEELSSSLLQEELVALGQPLSNPDDAGSSNLVQEEELAAVEELERPRWVDDDDEPPVPRPATVGGGLSSHHQQLQQQHQQEQREIEQQAGRGGEEDLSNNNDQLIGLSSMAAASAAAAADVRRATKDLFQGDKHQGEEEEETEEEISIYGEEEEAAPTVVSFGTGAVGRRAPPADNGRARQTRKQQQQQQEAAPAAASSAQFDIRPGQDKIEAASALAAAVGQVLNKRPKVNLAQFDQGSNGNDFPAARVAAAAAKQQSEEVEAETETDESFGGQVLDSLPDLDREKFDRFAAEHEQRRPAAETDDEDLIARKPRASLLNVDLMEKGLNAWGHELGADDGAADDGAAAAVAPPKAAAEEGSEMGGYDF